jgi:hypothetical protein
MMLIVMLSACASDEDRPPEPMNTFDMPVEPVEMSASDMMEHDSGAIADMTIPQTPDMEDAQEELPPRGHEAISEYLRQRRYSNFAVEPAIHQSSGPHGGRVLTFVNAPLEQSLRDGTASHPVGSASIKELYRDRDEVQGWAVSVKVTDQGGPQDWYWYYLLSTASGATPSADGLGVPLCANCHSAGTDYLLTFGPFERP